jgi:hypothetical protein
MTSIKLPHPPPYRVDEIFELPVVEIVSPSSVLWDRSYKPEPGETWRTVEAPAGEAHELPVAVGPDSWITVTLDPAELVNL